MYKKLIQFLLFIIVSLLAMIGIREVKKYFDKIYKEIIKCFSSSMDHQH